jgi:formylglycine-generating enzyme required for sulfatase activity
VATLVAAGIWVALPHGSPPAERVGKDGAPADLVPAGTFVMGDGEYSPRREIFLDAFYIDRFEITTARYAKFLAATGSVRPPDEWEAVASGAASELPVIGVDWSDAAAYCAWAGRRLPTEAEWEKAARGADARAYPWGNESPSLSRANYVNTSPEAYDGGLHKVGSHPAGRSPYGTHDMAGNVSEWVADWHAEGFPAGGARNPKGPDSGKARVIRGGGRFDSAERIASARRWHGPPDLRSGDIGFRCAADTR